jgi:hypothetical protein
VKQNLSQRLQQQQIHKMILELRAKAKIEEKTEAPADKK